MARFLAKRLALSVVTLFILSVVVFAAAQLLPGDVGRNVLGPFADQAAVDALNHQVGADRPIVVQYGDWIWHFVQGDMGKSLQYQVPVWSLLKDSLVNSLSSPRRPSSSSCRSRSSAVSWQPCVAAD